MERGEGGEGQVRRGARGGVCFASRSMRRAHRGCRKKIKRQRPSEPERAVLERERPSDWTTGAGAEGGRGKSWRPESVGTVRVGGSVWNAIRRSQLLHA